MIRLGQIADLRRKDRYPELGERFEAHAGSEGGPGKRTVGNDGTAPRARPYSRQEALEWAASCAVACCCAQEVREFMFDPLV